VSTEIPKIDFATRLRRSIEAQGVLPIAYFMAAANAHYYGTRDPLGAAGDFITAPEISQMFGELCGLWLADLWDRAGRPANPHYVEFGPGRGTLAVDALRAMRRAGLDPDVHLIETSPALRKAQADRLPDATWHDDLSSLPSEGPLLVIANEFFDALPVRQIVHGPQGWFERMVTVQHGLILPVLDGPPLNGLIPEHLHDSPVGSIIETSPASVAIAGALGERIAAQGGAALVVDYGYDHGPAIGDTLQAVRGHGYANPFDLPGDQDLTAHVDFATIGVAAHVRGVHVHGPVGQGAWLDAMGIALRAEALARATPDRRDEIMGAHHRLTHADEMGVLFRAMALIAPEWPQPVGFANSAATSS
jgi:SAM-dependent MidA family methyltransferase